MDRITGKQVQSMMEALNQVYVQPEVEQLDEELNLLREFDTEEGSNIPSAAERQRRAKEKERARIERDRLIQQAGGGAAREAERIAYRKANPEKSSMFDPTPSADDEVNAKYNTRVQGEKALRQLGGGDLEKGLEIFRKQQAERATANAKDQKTDPPARTNPPAGGNNNLPQRSAPAPAPAKTYKVGDKQMSKAEINREYARLRKDDPAAAKAFGDKAFAATNPKIAAASAERARTRGTSATTNPQMADMKSRLPAPRPATPAPRLAATSFNPNAPRVVPTAPRPTAGASAVARPAAGSPAPRFNPNAPRVVPTVPRTAAGTPAVQKKRQRIAASADLFDIIRGELLDEGYSEEDAMHIMANLNWEERNK